MIDASKFPKAARLQQQREEKWEAEQVRLRAAVLVKPRTKRRHKLCKAAEDKVAQRRGK